MQETEEAKRYTVLKVPAGSAVQAAPSGTGTIQRPQSGGHHPARLGDLSVLAQSPPTAPSTRPRDPKTCQVCRIGPAGRRGGGKGLDVPSEAGVDPTRAGGLLATGEVRPQGRGDPKAAWLKASLDAQNNIFLFLKSPTFWVFFKITHCG